jgi:hypothetical protein
VSWYSLISVFLSSLNLGIKVSSLTGGGGNKITLELGKEENIIGRFSEKVLMSTRFHGDASLVPSEITTILGLT